MKFAVAALMAVNAYAVGLGDGSSYENRRDTVLIDDENMTLTIQNYAQRADGVDEFHGDLLVVHKKPVDPYPTFGFCFNDNQNELWDCLQVRAELQKGVDGLFDDVVWTYRDSYTEFINGEPEQLTRDTDWVNSNKSVSFKQSLSKSDAECEVVGDQFQCSILDAHWFRDFVTPDSFDFQLSRDMAGDTNWSVRGFSGQGDDAQFTPESFTWGESKDFIPVSEEFVARWPIETPAEEEEETPAEGEEETPAEEEEETPGEEEEETPAEEEEETPAEEEEETPGEEEEETPAEEEEETPGDEEEETPGDEEEETSGDGGEETPGDEEEETSGDGGEETPVDGGEETPVDGGEETPEETENTEEPAGGEVTETETPKCRKREGAMQLASYGAALIASAYALAF